MESAVKDEDEWVDWYVVFKPAEHINWFTRWLHKDFGHCYMVRWDGWNWIRVRPNLGNCIIEVLPFGSIDDMDQVVIGTFAVHIDCPIDQPRVRIPWLLTPATCVEACKAIIGIRNPFILTPKQLFNHLRKADYGWWRRRRKANGRTAEAAETSTG